MQFNFPMVLDGPMGTELDRRGVDTSRRLWSALASDTHPELVEAIHREHIALGADVITANTFRTNTRAVVASGLTRDDARRLTLEAVALARRARNAAGRPDVLIAGSDAPVEDCYWPELVPGTEELRHEHHEHIAWLLEAGCDFILIETMNRLDEALAACSAARELNAPFMVSVVTDPAGEHMLSGESLRDAVLQLAGLTPAAILTNCISPRAAAVATAIIADVHNRQNAEWRFGAYPNGSQPDAELGYERMHPIADDEYLDAMRRVITLGAEVVGTCCGSEIGMLGRVGGRMRDEG